MSKLIDLAKVLKRRLYTGEKISCIGMGNFGFDRFSAEEISNAVYGVVQCGYRLFDCASVYQNENQIGEVFEKSVSERSGEKGRASHHVKGVERYARKGRRSAFSGEDLKGLKAGLCGYLFSPLAISELSRAGV